MTVILWTGRTGPKDSVVEVRGDSSGAFLIQAKVRPGCRRIAADAVAYDPHVWHIRVARDTAVSLGVWESPVRPTDSWTHAHLLCGAQDTLAVHAYWAADTVERGPP